MKEFDQKSQEAYSRKDLLQRIRDYSVDDLDTMSLLVPWINEEVTESGLEGTAKGRVLFVCKKAGLYFDAGYPGEAIKVLAAEKEAAAKEGLGDYFEEVSYDLQKAIDEM